METQKLAVTVFLPTRIKVPYQRNKAHTRYRTKSGLAVPGSTTVLGIMAKEALVAWAWKLGTEGKDYRKVRDQAADIGSLAHFMINCYLLGKEPDLSEFSKENIDQAENSFLKFVTWWDDNKFTVMESELPLVSEKYLYGGTTDCIAKDQNGKIVLIDFKTSKGIYDEYISQLVSYSKLYAENYGTNIDRHIIIRIGKESQGDFEVREYAELEKYWDVFTACLHLYYAKQKLK